MLCKLKTIYLSLFICVVSSVCSDTAGERVKKYYSELKTKIPGSALISQKLELEGLTLKNFVADTGKAYTIVSPGETVTFKMDFSINPDKVNSSSIRHYVYGLSEVGPIDCLAHSLGIFERKGHTEISFKAPKKDGIYELKVIEVAQYLPVDYKSVSLESASDTSTIGLVVVDSSV